MASRIRVEPTLAGGFRVVADLKPFDKLGLPLDRIEYALEVGPDRSLRPVWPGKHVVSVPLRFVSIKYARARLKAPPQYQENPIHGLLAALAGTGDSYTGEMWLKGLLTQSQVQDMQRALATAKERASTDPDTKKARRRLGMRAKMYAKFYNGIWRRVLPLLDPEALRMARASGLGLSFYNALVGNRDLRDLVRACAPLGRLVALELDGDGVPEFAPEAKFRDRIAALLARCHRRGRLGPGSCELSPGFLKWLKTAKTGPSLIFQPGIPDIVRNLANLGNRLDPNGIAKLRSRRSWYCFHVFAAEFPDLVPNFLRDPERAAKLVYEHHPPHMRVGKRYVLVKRVIHEIQDANGFGRHRFDDRPRVNGMWDTAGSGEIDDSATSNLGFPALLERAKRWHRQQVERAREARKIDDMALDIEFPRPKFTGHRDAKYELVWLSTPRMLLDEGAEMHHCVGSYAPACRRRQSIIYGLRTAAGERVATLELGENFGIRQFYGSHDSLVPDAPGRWTRRVIEKARKAHQPCAHETGPPEATGDFDPTVVEDLDAALPF